MDAFVVDDDGGVAEPGVVGELHVRGPTVTEGYEGSGEERLGAAARPLWRPRRDPVYRTGDLVHRDDEGFLWLVGRRDAQIKSRGHRIELGDIERVLYRHDAVLECAVKAVPDELVTNRIEAHVVVRRRDRRG